MPANDLGRHGRERPGKTKFLCRHMQRLLRFPPIEMYPPVQFHGANICSIVK